MGSPPLTAARARALTAQVWEGRVNTMSKYPSLPIRCTSVATGKSLTLSDEIAPHVRDRAGIQGGATQPAIAGGLPTPGLPRVGAFRNSPQPPSCGWPQMIKDTRNLERARWRLKVRQSAQVVSGTAREEAVGRPPESREGTMSTALQDPPARLLNLPSPPPEPVKPPSPLSLDTSELLERLDRLRSAAGNSRCAAEPHHGSARKGADLTRRKERAGHSLHEQRVGSYRGHAKGMGQPSGSPKNPGTPPAW